ncbi:NAD-dependent epimerase/dehydratase family protein (plasmid) [Roseobacteraceae bacterium NS-SX3]
MPDTGSLQGRKVFVTGASGFIGRALLPQLRAAGAEVTALTRSRHGARALQRAGVRVQRGSLTGRVGLEQVLTGQDSIINLAYDVRASGEANLAAFQALYSAAAAAGVPRFVHASSIVVYDGWPHADLDEESPIGTPGGSPYRQAKMAMEQALMAGPLAAAILQPTLVYGPGSTLWTDRLAGALAAGTIVLPEPEGLCNAVYAADAAQALVRAAAVPELGRERFIVTGPEPVRWRDLLEGYAGILGSGSLRHLPYEDLSARLGPEGAAVPLDAAPPLAARASAAARRLLGPDRIEALVRGLRRRAGGGRGEMWPDRHLLEVFAARGACSSARAEARLGYRPDYPLEKGLAATADYLKARFG